MTIEGVGGYNSTCPPLAECMLKLTNRKHNLTAETTKERVIKCSAFMMGLMLW